MSSEQTEQTFNDLVHEAMNLARTQYERSTGDAKHWFGQAIDHLDDALTRYNGGIYHTRGTFRRTDPDKP